MAVFKCKMCGAQLEVEQGSTVATCAYCGSKQTVASADDERKEAMFNRANELRMRCEFDKALLAYQSILTTFPDEPEAHWGIVICRYGIEYVDDPITKTKKPTIHRASYDSILKDSDYLEAISRADVIARELYQQQAKEIADIQTSLLAISQKEEPFDIFICYKETDEKGKRTPDSVLAQEIYGSLTDRGYKVFFARITLENKLGVMYEPYIFAALNSAKIMLVIGTKKEYFEAVWVKNEWSRYLDLMRTRPDRYLIPCYRDIVAYEMPEEFLALQAQDLSKLGFLQDLNRGIDKIMGKNTATPAQTTKVIQTGVNVDALLTRAEILIGDGDFQKADALLERALDNDPRSSQAYLLKLLIELGVTSIDKLRKHPNRLDDNGNFKKAYNFGDKAQREKLDGINDDIDRNKEEEKAYKVYVEAMTRFNDGNYLGASYLFDTIPNYRDAKKLAKETFERYRSVTYNEAISLKENGQYDAAIEKLSKISNYRDSKDQIAECEELRKKATYELACKCRDSGDYDKAINLFSLQLTYLDSELQIENCKKLKAEAEKEAIYQSSVFSYKIDPRAHEERLRKACANLAKIPGYRDADQLLVQYEGMLKELEIQLAKEEEERAKARAKAIKKAKKIGAISGVGVLAISALVLSVAFIFVPNGKIGQSKQLLEEGRYGEALNTLKGLGPHIGYQETIKLARMCNAGISFQNKEYERGIDYVYNAGGTVDITYDANGGQASATSQTIKGIDYVNNPASKEGYTFKGWTLYSFSMKPSEYYAAITLRAKYEPLGYAISYRLNGGECEGLPERYETSEEVAFPNPTKVGHTFLGWTLPNMQEPKVDFTLPWGTYGDIVLTANWSANKYQVHLDSKGGTVSSNVLDVTYGQSFELPNPTYSGYTFLGWFDDNERLIKGGTYEFAKDINLSAQWSISNYSITYELDGGKNSEKNPNTYNVLTETFVLDNPTKEGYTFLGWTTDSVKEPVAEFKVTKGTVGDIEVTANWNGGNHYTVTLDPDGGEVEATSVDVQYGKQYSLPTPTKLGYTFKGWYDGETLCPTSCEWKQVDIANLKAKWEVVSYSIDYSLLGATNNPSNPDHYTVNDEFAFLPPTRDGYAFGGWKDSNSIVWDKISVGTTGDLSLTAQWSATKNNLSVTSEADNKGKAEVLDGEGYTDELITVVATPINECIFSGWYNGENRVSTDLSYSFVMPSTDYSLEARFWTPEEKKKWDISRGAIPGLSDDGKTVTYGIYPQTRVNDAETLALLNSVETPEPNGWYLLNDKYYAKPQGKNLWFCCEPIKWKVLSKDGNNVTAVASVCLEDRAFGETNIYKNSDIRQWLNNDFYSSAFLLGDSSVLTTLIDGDSDISDKVFLLSSQDYQNPAYGFSSDSSRQCKTTAWAIEAPGNYDSDDSYKTYWTRSEYVNSWSSTVWWYDHVNYIDGKGQANAGGASATSSLYVRPAITIELA